MSAKREDEKPTRKSNLLLETCVGESLLESHTLDQNRVRERAASHFFHADHFQIEVVLQRQNGIDGHLAKELLLVGDEFGV